MLGLAQRMGRRGAATLGRRSKTPIADEHCVTLHDRTFAALPLADPKGPSAPFDVDQWHAIPQGWKIADAAEVKDEVLQYGWNALALIAQDKGTKRAWCTTNCGASSAGAVWELDASKRLEQDGKFIKLRLGGVRVLVERTK